MITNYCSVSVNTSSAFVLTLPVLVPSPGPFPSVNWGLPTDGMGFDAQAVETSYRASV